MTGVKVLFEYQQLEVVERNIINERNNSAELGELRRIKAEFVLNKQQYLALINDIAALNSLVKNFPQQLAMQQEKIEAEQNAIYDGSVSSMKALATREAQLAALQERLAQMEGEKSACEEELVRKQAEVNELKQRMDEQYASFKAIKSDYEAAEIKRQQMLSSLSVAKNELQQQIPEAEMRWFEDQKDRFQGSPLAKLDANHVCGGCHTMVTPICYKRVTNGITSTCENCGRTLFVEESY